MKNDPEIARIAKIIGERQSISICLPAAPTFDALAAGTALYLALLHMGKAVGIASSGDSVEPTNLAGQDKIQTSLVSDGDNLVVSFPYTEGSVDKVTYNIEDEKFSLVVQPREGFAKLDPKKVSYSYTGGKPEAIITIYAPTLNALAGLYTSNKEQFTGVDIINIDRHFTNGNYGTVNFVDKKSASVSEMVLDIITALKIEVDKNIATNLYKGIVSATNNFTSHSVSANTFEASALLLKSGAVKSPMNPAMGMRPQPGMDMGMPYMNQPMGMGQRMAPMPPMRPRQPGARPVGQMPTQPMPMPTQAAYSPDMDDFDEDYDDMEEMDPQEEMNVAPAIPEPVFNEKVDVQQQPGTAEKKESKGEGQSSKEWLKPKIFKGTNLL